MAFRWTNWLGGRERKRVPTHVILGVPGAGKTTLLRSLLRQRPAVERWAVVLNEFGETPVHAEVLDAASQPPVSIHEVPGGCACCDARMQMQMTLKHVLECKPDRLLIEAMGLGHPVSMLRSLLQGESSARMDLRSTLCVVDARHLGQKSFIESEACMQQLQVADILLANKADVISKDQLRDLRRWANKNLKAGFTVLETTQAEVELRSIDRQADLKRIDINPDANTQIPDGSRDAAKLAATGPDASPAAPAQPRRIAAQTGGQAGYTWIFHRTDTFDKGRTLAAIMDLATHDLKCSRIRAVVRTAEGGLVLTWERGSLSVSTAANLSESRVEVLFEGGAAPADASPIERKLLEALSCR